MDILKDRDLFYKRASQFVVVLLVLLSLSFWDSLKANELPEQMNPKQVNSPYQSKHLTYIVSDINIPFWSIIADGIKSRVELQGYKLTINNSGNNQKKELQLAIQAIKNNVSGVILSPINSSSATTLLKLFQKAGIPVVIADIGTDYGEYLSYISSNNKAGAYQLGKVLTENMLALGWSNGSVGIVAIPQKRVNGRDRTKGFLQALKEDGINVAGFSQQTTFSYQETYDYCKEFITNHADLRAIWLQGSDKYQAALDAINDANKQNEILLVTFDVEPIFLQLISDKVLLSFAMQQPYLIGQKSIEVFDDYFNDKAISKQIQLEVIVVSNNNLLTQMSVINKNALGITN